MYQNISNYCNKTINRSKNSNTAKTELTGTETWYERSICTVGLDTLAYTVKKSAIFLR